jgi:hypothetical protein
MANIYLIGGEKGGVGKSLVARVLAQYMIDNKLPFIGFDTDRSHGALMRFYSGFASPVVVDRYETLDAIVEAAIAQVDRRVLVDLAAQTQDPLTKWMDAGRDSVDLLAKLLRRFGKRIRYVLVLNQLRGDDFSILRQSGELALALALGARTISIKRLNEGAIQKIDASSSSFWAAKNAADKESTGLGLMDRQRVKLWLRDAYQQLDTIGI